MWGNIIIAFILAVLTSFVITPYTMRLAKKVGALDIPEKRKVHKKPIPRLGGIAVIVGFFVSVIYLLVILNWENVDICDGQEYILKLLGFFIGIILLGITCFIDDAKGLPSIVKLVVQIISAVIVCMCGIRIENINLPFLSGEFNSAFLYIITVCWIVGVTNAINLIDGLDGLSSGVSLVSCVSLILIFTMNSSPLLATILITALAGAILGFLPFNFNPAKTFIGDVGSNFLGFCLAVISILGVAKTYTALVLVAPIIILGLPIFDTLFAIIRRIIKGKSLKAVLQPDRGHLHHRLMDKGYTQRQSVIILYVLSATLGLFTIVLLESGIWKALSFALLVIVLIGVGYKDICKLRDEKDT